MHHQCLPLEASTGSDYFHSERIERSKALRGVAARCRRAEQLAGRPGSMVSLLTIA
jgi:hypothetical protein